MRAGAIAIANDVSNARSISAVAKLARDVGRLGMLAVLSASVVLAGCTTIKPLDLPPADLRDELRAGTVGTPGETMEVVTADGAEHAFEFVAIDQGADVVRGKDRRGQPVAVPIDDIVVVRERRDDRTSSRLLAVGVILAVVAAVFLADTADHVRDAFVDVLTPN